MFKEVTSMFTKMVTSILIFFFFISSSKSNYNLYWETNISSTENLLMILSCSIIFLVTSYESFSDFSKVKDKTKTLSILVVLFCSISFIMGNKFMFFLFFEISMIPMFVSVILFSKEESKIYSSMIMMIMNMALAVPTLMFMTIEFKEMKSFNICANSYSGLMYMNILMGLLVILMMMSKAPMFFMHMWLPKAHVDSFTMGSVILASLMIKLSVMGLMKMGPSLTEISSNTIWIIYSVSWSTIIISLMMMMRSVDIKKMAATSSIAHMGLALNTVLSMKVMGAHSSIMILFSHGLVSAMMFTIIGMMYEATEGRSLFSNKSMESLSKTLTMMWITVLFLNVGIPPTLTFFSEVLSMVTFFMMEYSTVLFISLSMILISSASMLSMTKINFMKGVGKTMNLKSENLPFVSMFFLFLVLNSISIILF